MRQYSKEASTLVVHRDLQTGAKGIKFWPRLFKKSNSSGHSVDMPKYGV